MSGRGAVVALVAAACASAPPVHRHLELTAPLTSALPVEARLQIDEAAGQLSINLRVAHSATSPMDDLRLLSCAGQLDLSGGAHRPLGLRPTSPLPARLELKWMAARPDGADKQPAYYEYGFEPVPFDGAAPAAVDYDFTATLAWRGKPVPVSGRGRAVRGQWRGSSPPSSEEAETRF